MDFTKWRGNSRFSNLYGVVGKKIPQRFQLTPFSWRTSHSLCIPDDDGRALLLVFTSSVWRRDFCDTNIIFRVLATWRWVYQRGTDLGEIMPSFPWILRTLLVPLISYKMKGAAWGQGIGRHKEAEVMEMGMKDLKALSSFLGRIIYLFIKSLC